MLLSPLTLDRHTVNVTHSFNLMERKKECHIFQWFVRVKNGVSDLFGVSRVRVNYTS